MVEKIIVNPESVRCYGDIISPKSLDDFETYMCGVSEGTDTVDGVETTVFTIPEYLFDDFTADTSKYSGADSRVTVTTGTFGIQLTWVSGTYQFWANKDGSTEFDYSGNFTVEFDVTSTNQNVGIQIYDNSASTYYSKTINQLGGLSGPCHVKIVKDGQTFKSFVDGVENTGQRVESNITGACRVGFRQGSSSSFSFKNFVVYGNDDSPVPPVPPVPTHLFYDDVTSDRSSEYRNESLQSSNKTNYLAMSYNSNGYYTIQASNNEGNHYAKFIPILDGEDNIRFSCEVNTNTNNGANRYGIVVGTADYKNERYQITNGNLEHQTFRGTTESLLDTQNLGLSTNTWYKMEFVVQGTSYTFTISDMTDTVLYTTTSTFQSNVITSSDDKKFGLYYLNYGSSYQKMFRNIKADYIE